MLAAPKNGERHDSDDGQGETCGLRHERQFLNSSVPWERHDHAVRALHSLIRTTYFLITSFGFETAVRISYGAATQLEPPHPPRQGQSWKARGSTERPGR